MEQITLTEAIKRYASVLTLEQIIVLRQFHREFTTAKVNVEPGMKGTSNGSVDQDKLTIELIIV